MSTLPYKIGICSSLVLGFGSIHDLDLNTALWFNEVCDEDFEEDLEHHGSAVDMELDEITSWSNELLPVVYVCACSTAKSRRETYTAYILAPRGETLSRVSSIALRAGVFSEGDPLSASRREFERQVKRNVNYRLFFRLFDKQNSALTCVSV